MSKYLSLNVALGDLARRLNLHVISPLTTCTSAFEMPSDGSAGSMRLGLLLSEAYWLSTAPVFSVELYLHMTMLEFGYLRVRAQIDQSEQSTGDGWIFEDRYHLLLVAETNGQVGTSRVGDFGPELEVHEGCVFRVDFVLENELACRVTVCLVLGVARLIQAIGRCAEATETNAAAISPLRWK